MEIGKFSSLASGAAAVVSEADLERKIDIAYAVARQWFQKSLPKSLIGDLRNFPNEPGRPDGLVLLPPRDMPRRRPTGLQGRLLLLHSLAHIELSAVDMTWDIVGRFSERDLPRRFFDNWVQVGLEEAKHFGMLRKRLEELGSYYGALPAHAGLWETSQATAHDLTARLAIIPLVLEARGLDVSPGMIRKLEQASDQKSAEILKIIYRDEKRHVAFGTKWFKFLCDKEGRIPEPTFHRMVRTYFRGGLKPPFNDAARSSAGLTPGFYKPLTSVIG